MKNKTKFFKTTASFITMIAFIIVAFGSMDNDTSINLDNDTEVQNYIQGKWEGALYPSAGKKMIFRLLIEGNQITMWEKMETGSWDMDDPRGKHAFYLSQKFKGTNDKYYINLFWEDEEQTLLQRSINPLIVTEKGLKYRDNWLLDKGWKEE